jgi:hypothetical protein
MVRKISQSESRHPVFFRQSRTIPKHGNVVMNEFVGGLNLGAHFNLWQLITTLDAFEI